MERYSEYKDSGEQWLGEIPSHWEVKRWHVLMNENTEQNTNCSVTKQLQFKYGSIIEKNNQDEDKEVLETISKYLVVKPGDIMLNGLNLNYDFVSQRVGQVTQTGVITSAYICLRSTGRASENYLVYLLKAMDSQKLFHGMGTGVRLTLSYKELKNVNLILPPLSEQSAIVAYLDRVTSQLDEAIAQQQRMIDLLNERKQIIIQHAVTKGLDPKAEMVESGVEWCNQIPHSWSTRRLRYLCNIKTGDKDTIMRVEDGIYPFFVRSPKVERINSYTFDKEAILMAGDGAGAGRIFHYYKGKFGCHQRVYCIHNFVKEIYPLFLYYQLSTKFKEVFLGLTAKSTVDSVRLPMLKDFQIIYPSYSEQCSIVKYIEEAVKPIDLLIDKNKHRITLLRERKQIIINEVITGKVKVS